jgi:hypothetical protein
LFEEGDEMILLFIYRPFEEGDEVVLCSLQLDANGVLCIRPDFNRGRKPYVAETASLGRGKKLEAAAPTK